MKLTTLLVPLLAFLSLCEAASAQSANAYNITIFMGDSSKVDPHEGKLKMDFAGSNFKYRVVLSAREEMFRRGSFHTYLVAAPYTINQIDRVILTWSRKKKVSDPSSWFSSPKIYVSKVTIDPAYIQNYGMRRTQVKSFCAAKDNAGIKVAEEVTFRFKC